MRIDRPKLALGGALIASLVLYLVGVPFAVPVACVAAGAYLLPSLAVLNSVVGRVFLSVFVFFSVFQAAATVQFFVLPSTRFAAPAAMTVAVYLAVLLLSRPRSDGAGSGIGRLFSRHEAPGAIVAAIFLLPFVPVLFGGNAVGRITQIGGSQGMDASSHFYYIARMMEQQHWSYSVGDYYPSGFHITTAFLQDSLFVSQISADWRQALFVFIGQYLVAGALLGGAIGYFLSSLFAALSRRLPVMHPRFLLPAAGVAAGAMAGPFLLWPLVNMGFLSYFYVIATTLLAFAVLMSGSKDRLFSTIALYLVLVFGTGLSWPLLIPPLLATLVLFLCQQGYLRALLAMPKRHLIGLGVLFAVQFVPLAIQLRYGRSDTGINLTGGLTAFHPLSLLLSALIIVGIAAYKRVDREPRDRSVALLLPLLGFIGLLALMQFFTTGEVRYYVIKSSFLLESMNYVFLACLVALALSQVDMGAVGKFFAVAAVPAVVVLSMLAVTVNPLSDLRNLFKTASGQEKTPFFDEDLELYADLGVAGEIDGINTTVLHYDDVNEKYFASVEHSYWANMMQFDGTDEDKEALVCYLQKQFNVIVLGSGTEADQEALIDGIKECARRTADRGLEFVIVTDPGSEDVIRREFGRVAEIVTHEDVAS
jgi:hypothetical protein